MKKSLIIMSLILNIVLTINLLYVLNLKYYDGYYDISGNYHNEEEKILDLVKRIIVEQGGF